METKSPCDLRRQTNSMSNRVLRRRSQFREPIFGPVTPIPVHASVSARASILLDGQSTLVIRVRAWLLRRLPIST